MTRPSLNLKNCRFSRKIGQKLAKIGQNRRPELARGQKSPARARPGPKKASPNPTRARKKVARPSPTSEYNGECDGMIVSRIKLIFGYRYSIIIKYAIGL